MTKGLRGSEISSLPQNEEELAAHMEKVHHMPVQREGETDEECIKRFVEKYPEPRHALSASLWGLNGRGESL